MSSVAASPRLLTSELLAAIRALGCFILCIAEPALAQFAEHMLDPPPSSEALPGYAKFDEEPQGSHHDANAQGSFTLGSVMALKSTRMPVLVDVFPTYSPRAGASAWGQGWRSNALFIERSTPARFDDTDTFGSQWGRLQRFNDNTLYPQGLLSRVRGVMKGEIIEVHEANGTVWTYDGRQGKNDVGDVTTWRLSSVVDQFGNSVSVEYTPDGNLSIAEWRRQNVPQHQVEVSYQRPTNEVPVEPVLQGSRTRSQARVREVLVRNADRSDGILKVVVSYVLHFDVGDPKAPQTYRPWLLSSVTEFRQGVARTTTYNYGQPWAYSTQKFVLRPTSVGDTLPTYPPQDSFMAMTAGDIDKDGRLDFLAANSHWWVNQGSAGYKPIPYRRPDASPLCTDPKASKPQLGQARHSESSSAFRTLRPVPADADPTRGKPLTGITVSQCSLDGALVKDWKLTIPPRPASSFTCPALVPSLRLTGGTLPFTLADIDGDGVEDISIVDTCRLLVWRGSWDGDQLVLGSATPLQVPLRLLDPTYSTAIVDLNGDGLADVIDYQIPQRAWVNRGLVDRLAAHRIEDGPPMFTGPFPTSSMTMNDAAHGWATLGNRLARMLVPLDNDGFIDLLEVWGPDPATQTGPFSSFHFVLYRGTPHGFEKIRQIDDDKWTTGWPIPVPLMDSTRGLSFVDTVAVWIDSKVCPEGSIACSAQCPANSFLRSTSRGGHGAKWFCTPLSFWAQLMNAEADLLTDVNNGRGDATHYEYAFSGAANGHGRGPIVLATRTRRITGRPAFSSQYTYETPLFGESTGEFLGFEKVVVTERQGATKSASAVRVRTSWYRRLGEMTVMTRADVQGSDGSLVSELTNHQLKSMGRVPVIRVLDTSEARTVNGVSGRATTTTYEYPVDGGICPSVVTWQIPAEASDGGIAFDRRVSKLTYASPARIEGALACLPATTSVEATHSLEELNFAEATKTTYDERGSETGVWAVNGVSTVLIRSAAYSPTGALLEFTATTGAKTRIEGYSTMKVAAGTAELELVEHIGLPDGRSLDFEFDPLTDVVLSAGGSRPDVTNPTERIVRRYAYTADAFGRPVSQSLWEVGFQRPKAGWLTIDYREPTAQALGARWMTARPFPGGTQQSRVLELVDGAGETVAVLAALSQKEGNTVWLIDSVADSESDTADIWRGGELSLTEGQIPSMFQLTHATGGVRTHQRKRMLSSLNVDERVYLGINQESHFRTTASLNANGALTLTRVDEAAEPWKKAVDLRRYDGAGRLTSTVSPEGRISAAAYDTEGRLRRAHFPGGVSGAADYDKWGRLATVRRGDASATYSYLPNRNLLDCLTIGVRSSPKLTRECYQWNAAAQPTQRSSYIGKDLDDVVLFTYPSGFKYPTRIEGRGYIKLYGGDGVDDIGQKYRSETVKLFPRAERVSKLPKHDPTEVVEASRWVHFREDGSVSSTEFNVTKNGLPLLENGLTCTDIRNEAGWNMGLTCGPLAISKMRALETTTYTMSTASKKPVTRTLQIKHNDALRTWDEVTGSGWSASHAVGVGGTFHEAFSYGTVHDAAFVAHDGDGAITALARGIPGTGVGDERYAYDSSGLLNSTQMPDTPAQTVIRDGPSILAGDRQWSVDRFGRVSPSSLKVIWNSQSQIVSAKTDSRSASYLYDESNRRLARVEKTADRQTTTNFWFNGALIRTESGGTPLQATVRIPIRFDGHVMAIATENGIEFADYDHHENLVGRKGVAARVQTPYGARTSHVSDIPEYSDAYFDDLLGTLRFGVRDYMPELGQFTTRDPLYAWDLRRSMVGGVSANLYTYASGNPLDNRDPSGFVTCEGGHGPGTNWMDGETANVCAPAFAPLPSCADGHCASDIGSASYTSESQGDRTGTRGGSVGVAVAAGIALTVDSGLVMTPQGPIVTLTVGVGGGALGFTAGVTASKSNARSKDQYLGWGWSSSPTGRNGLGAFGGDGYSGWSYSRGPSAGIPSYGVITYTIEVTNYTRGHMLGGGY